MFNIYYINLEKAFEISMMINNVLLKSKQQESQSQKQNNIDTNAEAQGEGGNSLFAKAMGKLGLKFTHSSTNSKKMIDTMEVNITKSIILEQINEKARKIGKLSNNKIGSLIKIEDVSLSIDNMNEIIATKSIMNGMIEDIKYEGVNINSFLQTVLKDSAYIFTGNHKETKISFKIPMQIDKEMESQYNITDLEIGTVTILGIYRGKHNKKDIDSKMSQIMMLNNMSSNNTESNIEDGDIDNKNIDAQKDGIVHYIDIIAIIQDLNID